MGNYRLLYYQPGTPAWKQMPLTGPSFTIGRGQENNLALNDKDASRQHASLYFDARGVWIMDQNSGNGVSISGRRIPVGEWVQLPLNQDIVIGTTTLRVEAMPPATFPSQQPVAPARVAQPRKTSYTLPTLGILGCLTAFACLVVGGVAAYMFLPGIPGMPPKESITFAPPTVIDSLPASPGAGPVQDDQGVSLSVPAEALEAGQMVYLERASLSEGMQTEVEKNYQVESLAYAAVLQDGQDGIGQMDLALPAKSANSQLAVLVDDKWLGVLETPAQDGVFHIGAHPSLGGTVQAYYGSEAQAPNRYLVLTPKTTSSQSLPGGVKLASYPAQSETYGKACITEFWAVNHCWRNPEGSVYVFWEDDFPASMKDESYLRVIDTVKAVATMMGTFEQNGFKSAAISASRPAYVIVEASATSPYYSWKTNNVYVPWDIVAGVNDIQNRCTLGHEFMHWIEDEEYRMGTAAMSGSKSWWMEVSADNGAFLLDSTCIEKNLNQYGIVNTSKNVLGFQAAPMQWESEEGARYIHSLQFYLSICEGGANCALSQAAWVNAINSGTYPMEGAALAAYERNAKDLGRFLLGAAPAESRAAAVIPPSAISGNRFGDYLVLRTGDKIWDFGLTMNQFTQATLRQVKVQAPIAKGSVYPLWVSNGTRTPMGGSGGATGLPGLLEIQAGPAFWLKKDQAAPVFYPAGTSLKLAPISDKLGTGAARIVAIAPDGDQTFQATLSLADLSGDWSATQNDLKVTPLDCPSYSADGGLTAGPDQLLQYFSGYGTFVKDTKLGEFSSDLIWQGTLPEGATGISDVTVAADKITLHTRLEIPEPPSGSSWLPGMKLGQGPARGPLQQSNALLSVGLALPLLGVFWLKRLRRKWAVRLALASLLMLGALLLSGCFGLGFNLWGTIDTTYTFTKLEYIDPTQPADAGAGGAANQPGVTWKLTNGQATYNYDLIIQSEVTDSDGKTTKENTPCKLTVTSNLTGTIGPEGTVKPPE